MICLKLCSLFEDNLEIAIKEAVFTCPLGQAFTYSVYVRHLCERGPPALVDGCGGGGDGGRKVVAVGRDDILVRGRGRVATRVDRCDLRRGVAPVHMSRCAQPPADYLLQVWTVKSVINPGRKIKFNFR